MENKLFEHIVNRVLDSKSGPKRHPKCMGYFCNHPLDPPEFDCLYDTIIDCDECKYGGHGGRKNPEAKCNQQK